MENEPPNDKSQSGDGKSTPDSIRLEQSANEAFKEKSKAFSEVARGLIYSGFAVTWALLPDVEHISKIICSPIELRRAFFCFSIAATLDVFQYFIQGLFWGITSWRKWLASRSEIWWAQNECFWHHWLFMFENGKPKKEIYIPGNINIPGNIAWGAKAIFLALGYLILALWVARLPVV